jgi:hypothetical protein
MARECKPRCEQEQNGHDGDQVLAQQRNGMPGEVEQRGGDRDKEPGQEAFQKDLFGGTICIPRVGGWQKSAESGGHVQFGRYESGRGVCYTAETCMGVRDACALARQGLNFLSSGE